MRVYYGRMHLATAKTTFLTLGTAANTDTKLLIYDLFQKGRVLAQDGVVTEGPVRGA